MPGALLDNGSLLNVMPMSTLSRLPIDLSDVKKVKWWSELSMGLNGKFSKISNF